MSGKLIVFEGTDGSGKATQAKLLCRHLEEEGTPFREINFPRYGEPSAAMVQEYLDGNLGKHPGDVNAFAASAFFPWTAMRPISRTGATSMRVAD